MHSKFRLYLIGIAMGIADLIPGVSGGTIAFICGIYEQLLDSIKTLQFQTLRKIAWPFLLPLGSGIATSLLLFAKLFYFLLTSYQPALFALFFGLIAASTVICAKEANMRKPSHFLALLAGGALSFVLTVCPSQLVFGSSFIGIVIAGMLGTGAMLLPGISGSYLLQIIGVYPLVIYALAMPFAPGSFSLLLAMGIGIAIGFIIFSRLISWLLKYFRQLSLSVLVGFMGGGLKALWPFGSGSLLLSALLLILGFSLIIFLEIRMKQLKKERGAN